MSGMLEKTKKKRRKQILTYAHALDELIFGFFHKTSPTTTMPQVNSYPMKNKKANADPSEPEIILTPVR